MNQPEAFVTIEGLESLRINVARMLDATSSPRVQEINLGGAILIRDKARQLAPVLRTAKKGRTRGLLRSAIYAARSRTPGDLSAIVSVNTRKAYYAVWLEFGNARIPAQPYMRPAVAATEDAVIDTLNKGYRELIEGSQ